MERRHGELGREEQSHGLRTRIISPLQPGLCVPTVHAQRVAVSHGLRLTYPGWVCGAGPGHWSHSDPYEAITSPNPPKLPDLPNHLVSVFACGLAFPSFLPGLQLTLSFLTLAARIPTPSLLCCCLNLQLATRFG
jgi:hypothetical protein